MTVLIHVLGLDIPHHSQTVLQFFSDSLAATSEHARTLMVAGQDAGLSESCPALSLSFYSGKKTLTGAVTAKARADRQQRFFFRGQLDTNLWLMLLSGGIKPTRFYWHIQGADLYEVSSGLKFRLFCPVHRMVQNRVGCVFATWGGLRYFTEQHPCVRGELLYFPVRMGPSLNNIGNGYQRSGKMTAMVGNSDDRNNEHVTMLHAVYQQFGDTVNVIVPMGYSVSNAAYIDEARQAGLVLFSADNLQILSEKLRSDAYLTLLR